MTTLVENEEALALLEAMATPTLKAIAEKVSNRVRLSREEGNYLFETEHLDCLQKLADFDRQQRVGDDVFFTTTLYIHPTNLCELSCPMCSFYAKPGWEKAWFQTPEEIEEKVRLYQKSDITEVHIVGGLWKDCDLDYYQDVFTRIKQLDPNLHIKAMTPVEYDYLAKLHGISVEEVLRRMKSWGLDSLPGGGAEVLVESIRKKVAPQKITSEEFLDIHKIAHALKIPTNITMLFGHVEENEHLVEHLIRVREVQDETGGFVTFVPLKYHIENNALGKRTKLHKPKDLRRVYAVSRLMLDNVDHIKALWNYLGVAEAKELLTYGANDISATQLEEKIITMAGGVQIKMTRENLNSMIREVGRVPVERDSGNRKIHRRKACSK